MDARCYFTLNLLYKLVGMSTLLLGVVFRNYEIISQVVLLASILYPAGLLSGLEPHPVTGLVKRKARVDFCVGTVVSLFFVALASITPIAKLAGECPSRDIHHHGSPASRQLEVNIRYTHHDRQCLLLLKYDVTRQKIVKRELRKHRPHGEEEERKSWLELESKTLMEEVEPVCSSEPVSRFFFLEREIVRELREKHREAEERPMLRVSPHRSEDQGYEELQLMREELDNREICRYEYGFTVLYLAFIGLVFLLQVVGLLWYTLRVKDGAE